MDGRMKIQLRLDLGLLQMDVEGRPDGRRPYGCDSFLTHHLNRLKEHCERNGTELGYELSADECRELRHEAAMYYQRYLALFALEDYDGVKRDTQRNLQVLELCRQFAATDNDRFVLEQYRPYILMMNSRAKAMAAIRKGMLDKAMQHVRGGLRAIKRLYRAAGHEAAFLKSPEVKILRKLRRQIKQDMPPDPVAILRKQLKLALADERYEEAAHLRDQLEAMGERPEVRPSNRKDFNE